MLAMRVAKAGYYGGDPSRVLDARVDHVMAILEYERFTNEYQEVEYELNKS